MNLLHFISFPRQTALEMSKDHLLFHHLERIFCFLVVIFLDAWLWGKEEKLEQGLQQVERAGLSGPWSYMHLNFSHPRFLI